jgi:microcystin-dependent protein
MAVSFNFPPKGWALCNGQLLAISQNQALFALLGTFYGGNGQTTFELPNLQSRIPVGFGQGQGLSNYNLGDIGGAENHTLIQSEMPQHTHLVTATSTTGSVPQPAGNLLGKSAMYIGGTANNSLAPGALANAGGSQPHTNTQPYLVINWLIALQGIFPTRN